ncbi:helix-turn-helix transcriptional regulator [Clostridium sp. YIM B02551]|uniref:helix-turn-helix transcriptional regulator n=1 Tax=Clostridium sp. YIM B02551 TaxID=2910679 RepID=UPI001EEB56A5|nr:helix-turn-helix transcriptional regulator [Clostridium sp. YIM B02551]
MAKPKIFKTNLKVLRAEKNITQEKLAEDIDVSRGTILEIERGTFNPSLKLAFKIAQYFDKRIDDIFELLQEDMEDE